jgi:predicted ester cyclase
MSIAQATRNNAAFRRFQDAMKIADPERMSKTIDEAVEPDVQIRTPLLQATGAQALKDGFTRLHQTFPDLQITIQDLIAEGDKVVSWNSITGTRRGEYLGIPWRLLGRIDALSASDSDESPRQTPRKGGNR